MGRDQAKTFVEETIRGNKVVMFSKTYCPYCIKAKRALNQFLAPDQYLSIELEQRSDGNAIQEVLGDMTGASTVPRVFIGGRFIGGGDDTAAKAASGELKRLLEAAGAMQTLSPAGPMAMAT